MSEHSHAPAGLEQTELLSPKTIDEACSLLSEARKAGKSAVLLAGGTDWMVDRHLAPIDKAHAVDRVIDLTRVSELSRIEEKTSRGERLFVLGGGVTYWQLRTDKRILRAIPMLATMAKDVGAVQIQTRGTLGGNIATASPAADGVPALMALDGWVDLAKVGGRRSISLDAFFTGYRKTVMQPDEIIASITVRVPQAGAMAEWRKVGTRLAQSISKVALASVIEIDLNGTVTRARFGMASVAAVTHPLLKVRALLEGKSLTSVRKPAIDSAIDEEVTPIDDVRSTGEYRLHVAKTLVWRALHPGV